MSAPSIKFGFNHMVCPALSPDDFLKAAVALGASAVELRNDIGVNSVTDMAAAREIGAKARDLGLEIRTINALYPFNVWTPELAAKAVSMAQLAQACGATGLVMCPLNEGRLLEDNLEKTAGLHASLAGIARILRDFGLKGFVEPLGFPFSSMRFKATALAAIDELGLSGLYSLVHDTFHHTGAGEADLFPARTGLVHISGLEDPAISFADMLDGHRVLVGPKDRLGNIGQLKALYAGGFDGIVSFEPFAREVHDLPDPIAAVRASMDHVRQALSS
ncbi:TIM barrel protein [Oryzibacter oryziterrae]|uniref:TIM barrel protein n=1 Tax=Oryzibacter oryziterrae TaxID=2766474 RepID=UPI0028BD565B|nr:TIM barrel protein [Oryzibacter oryziterrae]